MEKIMISIENVNPINKGSLLASCDVVIKPWKLTLHEVKIFQKGANRWVSLPSREYTNDLGEKKYIELMSFTTDAVKNGFKKRVLEAVEQYLEKNPDMEPEDVIQETDELPW